MGPGIFLEDGEPIRESAVHVEVTSPMWTAGQSLFETMLVWPSGSVGLYRAQEHVTRLREAAATLGWQGVPPDGRLYEWLLRAVGEFRDRYQGFGRMRLTVAWTRGPSDPTTHVVVVPYTRPVTPLSVVSTGIRLPWNGRVPTPKSGNRVIYNLADAQAALSGAEEGLLVDASDRPAEGAKSNLFVVSGGEVVTPPLTAGVLAGITRTQVIRLARETGIRVREEPLEPEQFLAADAYFMTNALWGVRPVARLDHRTFDGACSTTQHLSEAYAADVRAYLETGHL